jgi:alpha-galactosidase
MILTPNVRKSRSDPRLTRRELLRVAAAAPIFAMTRPLDLRVQQRGLDLDLFVKSAAQAVGVDGEPLTSIRISRIWKGSVCESTATNVGKDPVRVKEIVLFDVAHDLPPEASLYGEGFQMLTQTGGTIGQPVDLGNYTDPKHYRLPEPGGARTVYGLATIQSPGSGLHHVLAFTSCRRFSGALQVRPKSVQVVVDTEGLSLEPGRLWTLEDFSFSSGPDRHAQLASVADRLNANHPRRRFDAPPAGWCSWYCFGPRVTAQQVRDNLDVIARQIPGLKYIQIDDGYQPAMGDWLETGPAFGGSVQDVLKEIRARGFEPAIWVAPFIAEAESNLFKNHPDWFVKDDAGAPLRADRVTFGGWRRGPWYAVDGTHPAAQAHLERVFRTMRDEWGCTYFKLDANFWGAIHGGRFHDPRATRIEAYRRGMEAVLRGSRDAFVLGCNHPIWASTGLIHGSRSSNDIKREWKRIETTARQNLMRNWQNGRLWWNDPDAVVLTGDLPESDFLFHATAIFATGGMILSGDDLTGIPAERLAMLRKLEPPSGVAARFEDDSLRVGIVDTKDRRFVCLLNWDDTPQSFPVALPRPFRVHDVWKNEDLGRFEGRVTLPVGARTGRLLECTPV